MNVTVKEKNIKKEEGDKELERDRERWRRGDERESEGKREATEEVEK